MNKFKYLLILGTVSSCFLLSNNAWTKTTEWQIGPKSKGTKHLRLDNGIENVLSIKDKLYIIGRFTSVDKKTVKHIAQWDGKKWSGLGKGLNNFGEGLAEYKGNLVVGGGFTRAGKVKANRVAMWDGKKWSSLGKGLNAWVRAVWSHKDWLVAGGHFT